uniref:Odorant receptor, family 40, subfamily A, member 1 n=1 Tax=Latimeria chalumnae TaxID=7897 RepID=H3AM15_LATCH|nr:PREDICTED: olfactory receptor 8H1-like [Latimeria chalumnae]|eukprot:XP_006003079.1 PREDICTED: olfactory receptor 8H1-like [Latimeria chalumnae]
MSNVSSPTDASNRTFVQPAGFYLVGLTNLKNSEYLLVFLFLVYVITLLGNFTLIAVVYLHRQLHTPRYMTVFNLAVVDILHSTVLIPKTLQAFLFDFNYIGFNACFTQCFFAHYAGSVVSYAIVLMAYDRFVAICFPLLYPSINTNSRMFIIIASCWILLIIPLLYMVLSALKVSFCASVEIPYFYCGFGSLFRLGCGDTTEQLRMAQILTTGVLHCPLMFIALTYVAILVAVLKLDTAESRRKAISTCATHFILVLTVYVPKIVNYMMAQLSVTYSHDIRNITIVLSLTIPLMFNPVIYCLKTEEVRTLIFRSFKKRISPM